MKKKIDPKWIDRMTQIERKEDKTFMDILQSTKKVVEMKHELRNPFEKSIKSERNLLTTTKLIKRSTVVTSTVSSEARSPAEPMCHSFEDLQQRNMLAQLCQTPKMRPNIQPIRTCPSELSPEPKSHPKSSGSTSKKKIMHKKAISISESDNVQKIGVEAYQIRSYFQTLFETLSNFSTDHNNPLLWKQQVLQFLPNDTDIFHELLDFLFPSSFPLIFYEPVSCSENDQEFITLFLSENYEEAIKAFSKLPLIYNTLHWILLGICYAKYGDFDLAREQLVEVLRKEKTNLYALYDLAVIELKERNWDLCIEICHAVLSIVLEDTHSGPYLRLASPDFLPGVFQLRAICYFQLGYLLLASEDYHQAARRGNFTQLANRMRFCVVKNFQRFSVELDMNFINDIVM